MPCEVTRLAAIDVVASQRAWSVDRLAAACAGANGHSLLVIDDGTTVAGFVLLSRVLDEATVLNIAVDAAYRRRGLGGRLLDAALAQLLRDGARRCLLEVRCSNAAARRLYESRGFRLDGVRKNYYSSPQGREDALLMSLEF